MAQMVVEHGISSAVVGQSFGIPVTTVMDWAHRYRKDGAEALRGSGMAPRSGGRAAGSSGGSQVRRQAVVRTKREHPEQGTRKIRDLLARFEGLGISETTVRRVLHEEGLLEVRPEKVAKPQPEPRRFERAEPNQLWQSDIFTFLLRRHERLYVTAFLDDYSRYVVSLVVAHHQKSSLVMEALQRGIAEYGAPREVLTDQGRQYTAWRGTTEFEEELRRQGIRHIKSRPHHPQTLGKTERFWKTLWDEFLSRTVFARLCGLREADRALRPGLQLQASPPGHRWRGARGPLLPGGTAGAASDRSPGRDQRAGSVPGAAETASLLPRGSSR
jgi:transposase InsO family protein